MKRMWSLVRLARLDSSLCASLVVFGPILAKTSDWIASATHALPILFIGMCTFVANDLDDLDSDRVNHPSRPLPSGQLSAAIAAGAYFAFLAAALLTVKTFIPQPLAFLYYTFLSLVISYTYVEEHIPNLKALYVALVAAIPILIVGQVGAARNEMPVALSLILFMLGRELCKDFLDTEGDPTSFLQAIHPALLIRIVFVLQGVGVALLIPLISDRSSLFVFGCIGLLFLAAFRQWATAPKMAIELMKAEMAFGIYFLLP